jgi:hypothetical protein
MNEQNMRNSMRPTLRRVLIGVAAAAVAVTTASCGGSSNDNGNQTTGTAPAPVANTPPASASQNVDGFIAFLKLLVPNQQDVTQPLDVTTFVAPTDDTGLPDPSI